MMPMQPNKTIERDIKAEIKRMHNRNSSDWQGLARQVGRNYKELTYNRPQMYLMQLMLVFQQIFNVWGRGTGKTTGMGGVVKNVTEKYAADIFREPLQHTTIMETGGMKGRRKEMIRQEIHDNLKTTFCCAAIHSEYGMTELLSQAYSKGEGIFNCPPWMKILVRDDEDPLSIRKEGSGVINVIDLANIYSCSFIATDDAGKVNEDGSFEVLGRIDGSDLRGCSLMMV